MRSPTPCVSFTWSFSSSVSQVFPGRSNARRPDTPRTVRQLALAAEQGPQLHRAGIERVFGSYLELLADCRWLIILQAGRTAFVGNDPKYPAALTKRCLVVLAPLRSAWLRTTIGQTLLTQRHRRKKS